MYRTIEIRWHGRGGQGTVTAAKTFANACLHSGRYVQAFPEYGPERAGAPLQAYNRISPKKLLRHCPVSNPDIVAIVDASLIPLVNVCAGLCNEGLFLVNTENNHDAIKKRMNLKPKQKLYCIDATGIAQDCFGQPFPNSAMVGALGNISGLVSLDALLADVEKSFGKKFSTKVVNGNLEAVRRSWNEVAQA
ncbi:MAG: 2-oxoacid:acceptor oxidoreductase family protein [Smithella sp.]|nr:2-oxoacid:acceptor oxidoreductase family protein [Smithella sp.]